MIEPDPNVEEVYPDDLVGTILTEQPAGRPGIRGYDSPERSIFVWCDRNGAPRGILTIGSGAASRGCVTGGEFTILVAAEWRRRGIATKLYHAACDFYYFELDTDPLYTTAGAAWANKLLEQGVHGPDDTGN